MRSMRTWNSRPAWRAISAPCSKLFHLEGLAQPFDLQPFVEQRLACARVRAAASAGPDRGAGTLWRCARPIASSSSPARASDRASTAAHSSSRSSDQMCSSAWCSNSPRSRSLKPGHRPLERARASVAFPQSREMRSATAPSTSPRRGCARRAETAAPIHPCNCSSAGAGLA